MKKILSLFLALSLALSLLAGVSVFAATTTGSLTGSSVSYSFDDETGVYTLSGTGGLPHKKPSVVGVSSTILNSATKIVVGEGITELGYESLYGFTKVTEISFPSTLQKIQAGVFINTAFADTFTIPKTVTYLGGYTLMNNTKVTSFVFEDGRSAELKLLKETFKNMSGLNSIYIPDNVSIDTTGTYKAESVADLFGGSTKVSDIVIFTNNNTFKEQIESFDDFATSGLTICDIPSGVESYGGISGLSGGYWTFGNGTLNIYGKGAYTKNHYNCDYAWKGIVEAKDITKVIFNEGITEVPLYFCGCDSISDKPLESVTEVTFPKTLKAIGRSAFFKCTKLDTINGGFPEGLETIGDQCFQGCPLKPTVNKALVLPSTLKAVGANTFCNNSSANGYTVVSFGENSKLESIGKLAFLNVKNLKSIVIPAGVTTVGESAFQRSTSDLLEVYLEGKPDFDAKSFLGRTNVKIYALSDGVGTVADIASTRVYKGGDTIKYTGQKSVDIALSMPYDGVEGVLSSGSSFTVEARRVASDNKLPLNYGGGTAVTGVTATVTGDHVVKLRDIPEIAEGEKLIVTMTDAKDAKGNKIENNTVVLYKSESDPGLISATFYDLSNREVKLSGSTIEAGTGKMIFTSVDTEDKNVSLHNSDGTLVKKATFDNGTYTIEINGGLTPNKTYTLKRNGSDYITFTADSGKVGVSEIEINGSEAKFDYYNSTVNPATIYVMKTDRTLCKSIDVQQGSSGTFTDAVSTNADIFVTDSLDTLKVLALKTDNAGSLTVDKTKTKVSVTSFDANRTATFNGELGSGKHSVGLTIYKSTETKSKDDVVFNAVVTTDDNGSFTLPVKFSETAATGLYSVVIGDANGCVYENTKLAYSTKTDTENAFDLINEAAKSESSAEAVRQVISDNAVAMEFVYDVYDNAYVNDATKKAAYEEKTAELIAVEIKNIQADGGEGLAYENKADAGVIFRNAAITAAFGEGLITDITTVEGDISVLSTEPVKTWYNEKSGVSQTKTQNWQKAVTERLSGIDFESLDDFENKLTAALVLSIAEDPAGPSSLKEMLKDFASIIKSNVADFDASTDITDKACVAVADSTKTYSGFKYDDLVKDIKEYNNKNLYPETSGNNNKPSLGGGGGGGSTGPITVEPGYVDDEIPSIKNGFNDIDGYEWARVAIESLYEKGIVNGKSEGIFAPEENVLREEFTKMVVCLANIDGGDREMNFADVNESDWYFDYIKSAYGCGIVNGMDETTFGAGVSVTRQDICVMIANILKYKGVDMPDGEITFADKDEIADYAADAVATLTKLNILNGYDDNTFRPDSFATRAEAAKMIYAMTELI